MFLVYIIINIEKKRTEAQTSSQREVHTTNTWNISQFQKTNMKKILTNPFEALQICINLNMFVFKNYNSSMGCTIRKYTKFNHRPWYVYHFFFVILWTDKWHEGLWWKSFCVFFFFVQIKTLVSWKMSSIFHVKM